MSPRGSMRLTMDMYVLIWWFGLHHVGGEDRDEKRGLIVCGEEYGNEDGMYVKWR